MHDTLRDIRPLQNRRGPSGRRGRFPLFPYPPGGRWNAVRARWASGRKFLYTLGGMLLLLLTGCFLVSGERLFRTPGPAGGEVQVRFVSADGETERRISLGRPLTPVRLEVTVEVDWGELDVEVIGEGLVSLLHVRARYGQAGQGTVLARSDVDGSIRLRVRANEARNGRYTIRYTFQESRPTPTPTPAPIPSPAAEAGPR